MSASAAVVLMAYGSPDTLADVPAYLSDIRGGRPVRPETVAEFTERYRRLGIEEKNPLNAITERTRAALQSALGVPVFAGMKHWRPRVAEAAALALAGGADAVVGLVLAPHFSRLSVGGYEQQLKDGVADRADLLMIRSWHDEPALVEFLAQRIEGARTHVVFTAHSLPARILDEGDPYHDELLTTSRLVAERAGVGDNWSFAYQSASETGEPWLGPDVVDHLAALHAAGVEDVLVCPVGFVADHLEIFWDLDTEASAKADELGMRYARIAMPNDDPEFIAVLAGLVRRTLSLPSPV